MQVQWLPVARHHRLLLYFAHMALFCRLEEQWLFYGGRDIANVSTMLKTTRRLFAMRFFFCWFFHFAIMWFYWLLINTGMAHEIHWALWFAQWVFCYQESTSWWPIFSSHSAAWINSVEQQLHTNLLVPVLF
jgi:hypothetical protein